MLKVTYDASRAEKKIATAKKVANGDDGRLRPAWRAAGLSLLGDVRSAYKLKARGETDEAGIKWPPDSPITLLLRRGPKIGSWAELEGQKTEVGRDENTLYGSLSFGEPGNVFEVTNLDVTVGTNTEHAERFHAGGETSGDGFIMTPEMYQRVRQRVAKPRKLTKRQRVAIRKHGKSKSVKSAIARGVTAATVDPQRELRDFNRQVFGILFGMEAKGAMPTQPARPIVPTRSSVPSAWIKRARDAFNGVLKAVLKAVDNG
jgi:ribosomal protein S6E (S10)